MHEIPRGVTAPKGFLAAGIHCGIKKVKRDLALIVSAQPCLVTGVFTTSKIQAAPVLVDKQQLTKSKYCSAVIINSGNANACTGEQGLRDAWAMVAQTAKVLGVPKKQVLVSSTGVIGQFLPMKKIKKGIPHATKPLSRKRHNDAAHAILTTDKFTKEVAVRFNIGLKHVTIGGMAKGSGMIAPNMATMLAFIATDAAISHDLLVTALRKAVDKSFNRITVDGDTSTNDMVLILANGLAKNKKIQSKSKEFTRFYNALEYVLVKLAKLIVRDGEGATKLIEVTVKGAEKEETALQAAKTIANSNLVKTAIHGEDANWGRILAAVGYSGIDFKPEHVEISFNHLPILKKNFSIVLSEEKAKRALSRKNVSIIVNLNQGKASAKFWTCDLSKEYITINAKYRS